MTVNDSDTGSVRLEQMILAAVDEIFRAPDFNHFRTWARQAIPDLLGMENDDLSSDERARLGALLGIAVWNITPLPEQNYQPRPINTPTPHQPCFCGSGRRFADCCAHAGDLPSIPPDLVWELLVEDLSEAALQTAISHNAIPAHLLARVAIRWLESGRPRRAMQLLEPLFDATMSERDERFEVALSVLCDSYDALEYHTKKRRFLLRVTTDGSTALKAAAWQRLSTIAIDEGDFERAYAAFEQALRYAPNTPSNALLEITLLATQGQNEQARARAQFWQHKLRRTPHDDDTVLDFLAQAIIDPQAALANNYGDYLEPSLIALRDWLQGIINRPQPNYTLPDVSAAEMALLPDHPTSAPLSNTNQFAVLQPPPDVQHLEHLWRHTAKLDMRTPLALALDTEQLAQRWVQFLTQHPHAADSLAILDGLVMLIDTYPAGQIPWLAQVLLQPVCERALSIITTALTTRPTVQLPWLLVSNRPASRLLFRLYRLHVTANNMTAAITLLEFMLQLNPQDSYGLRAELMNQYLRCQHNERALQLAEQFHNDVLVETTYGAVLALYRLGQQQQAAAVLKTALQRLPRVPLFLIRQRIKRPSPSEDNMPDTEQQAWQYREAMRDVWLAEDGLLAWLKRAAAL